MSDVTLSYESWGELNEARNNAVLIVHALTGDSHAAGEPDEVHRRGGWWHPLIGPGRPIDTERYFVICSNVLGGCSGSTGPSTPDPETGGPYAMRFPVITIRDMVRAQKRLLELLGIERLAAVAGGSIGGQQALEWAVEYPGLADRVAVIAANAALNPQGLGMSELGRRAIMSDPEWREGDYYGTGKLPESGLAIARMAGMLTYQSVESQRERFGRERATRPAIYEEFGGRFEVESYLHYQGRDLIGRFDPNSYLYLTRAMDLYDVGAGYESRAAALARIQSETLFVGISSDWLFPAGEVLETAEQARSAGAGGGAGVEYREIESPNGHDSFLKDWEQMRAVLGPFMSKEGCRRRE